MTGSVPKPLFDASPMERTATISEDGRYRYRLGRRWADGPTAVFVMLNPSTADAEVDDPTIRRCIGFAKREGMGGLEVINQFAYRATDPAVLLQPALAGDVRGKLNFETWGDVLPRAALVVCAWGAWFDSKRRPKLWHPTDWYSVAPDRVVCLGRTKTGAPRHPLYVRADQPFEAWS